MPRRWCAACAFVRSFAYSERPLAGETERRKRRERNGETAKTGQGGETAWGTEIVREKKREKEYDWMTGRDREERGEGKKKSREKTRRVENVSSGCRFASLTGTVWRTMLLLVECDVCPLSNSTRPQRKHTYNQVSIMHLIHNNLPPKQNTMHYSNIQYSQCVGKKKQKKERNSLMGEIKRRWDNIQMRRCEGVVCHSKSF